MSAVKERKNACSLSFDSVKTDIHDIVHVHVCCLSTDAPVYTKIGNLHVRTTEVCPKWWCTHKHVQKFINKTRKSVFWGKKYVHIVESA